MFTSSPVNNFDGIAGLRFIQVYLTALVTNSAVYNFVSTTWTELNLPSFTVYVHISTQTYKW